MDADAERDLLIRIIRVIVAANDTVEGACGEVEYALGPDAAALLRRALNGDAGPAL